MGDRESLLIHSIDDVTIPRLALVTEPLCTVVLVADLTDATIQMLFPLNIAHITTVIARSGIALDGHVFLSPSNRLSSIHDGQQTLFNKEIFNSKNSDLADVFTLGLLHVISGNLTNDEGHSLGSDLPLVSSVVLHT